MECFGIARQESALLADKCVYVHFAGVSPVEMYLVVLQVLLAAVITQLSLHFLPYGWQFRMEVIRIICLTLEILLVLEKTISSTFPKFMLRLSKSTPETCKEKNPEEPL